ncbi:MAG: hypothetical protein WA989_02095 [Henriciella sp.]|uniref:hypothetical protein n=1 Tax=Henriciella sp. TaxID=1968823 RepID=UPI003C77B7F2
MIFKRLPTLLPAALLAGEAMGETQFVAEAVVSSMLIDRGEQIGGPTLEVALLAEKEAGAGVLYGGLYRLTPFGDDQAAFADEFDYTIGYGWQGAGYAADVSANWLTYPGEGDEASLELFGEVVLVELPLSPAIAGFYDAEFEDYGLEVTAGPEWGAGDWSGYAIGRAGFVEPGDGSETRSYAGVEIGAVRPVSETAEIGGYARYEVADQDSFADDIANGAIISAKDSGFAVGAFVAATF